MSSDPDQVRAALTQSPEPGSPHPQRPPLKPKRRLTSQTLQSVAKRTATTFKKQWAIYVVLSVVITVLSVGISLATAYRLLVNDVNYTIPVDQGRPAFRMTMNLLAVDPIAGTLTFDWYPLASADCRENPPGGVFGIYFDPNLLLTNGGGNGDPPPSNAPATTATFTFDATRSCKATLQDSASTFRTTAKLISDDNLKGSLQAFPFDLYKSQISLFALDTATNGSVRFELARSWGVAVNFDVSLNEPIYNTKEGMYFTLGVSRSSAVKVFVMFIVIANWIVTIVFLWITIACLFWQERVVRELFVVPVSVLFAFTAVRSSMPGSPAGFGAFIDFVGILPNLALLTFCSFILLLVVLYQRIADTHREMRRDEKERKRVQAQMDEDSPPLADPEPYTPQEEKSHRV